MLSEENIAIVLEQLDKSSFEVENGKLVAISPDGTARLDFIPLADAATNRGLPPGWFQFFNPYTGAAEEIESHKLNQRLADEWIKVRREETIKKHTQAQAERGRQVTKQELLDLVAATPAHLIRAVVGCVGDPTKSFAVDANELEPERLNSGFRLAGIVWLGYGQEYRSKALFQPNIAWAQACLDFIIQRAVARRFNPVELARAIQAGVLFGDTEQVFRFRTPR